MPAALEHLELGPSQDTSRWLSSHASVERSVLTPGMGGGFGLCIGGGVKVVVTFLGDLGLRL